jgi:hypothetical protein
MIPLIITLIFCATTWADVAKTVSTPVFASSPIPVKITRTHLSPDGDEIYNEYIYKDGDKIRIDMEYGVETITLFVYDGKTGYRDGKRLMQTGSAEMVLYGCDCGYLSAIDKIYEYTLNGKLVLLAEGRQGNRLYLDYKTHLPIRYEWYEMVIEFDEYKTIEGFGRVPFLITKTGSESEPAISRITDIVTMVRLPANFFSVPKPSDTETLD